MSTTPFPGLPRIPPLRPPIPLEPHGSYPLDPTPPLDPSPWTLHLLWTLPPGPPLPQRTPPLGPTQNAIIPCETICDKGGNETILEVWIH